MTNFVEQWVKPMRNNHCAPDKRLACCASQQNTFKLTYEATFIDVDLYPFRFYSTEPYSEIAYTLANKSTSWVGKTHSKASFENAL